MVFFDEFASVFVKKNVVVSTDVWLKKEKTLFHIILASKTHEKFFLIWFFVNFDTLDKNNIGLP